MIELNCEYSYVTVCSCHVMYTFQGESTLYIGVNIKEMLVHNRWHIRSLSDSNGTQTNHLVRKRTLKPLGKLTK